MPTRSALVLESKDSFVLLVTNLNNKSNVCKKWYLLWSQTTFKKEQIKNALLSIREIRPAKPTNQSARTNWANTIKLLYLVVIQRDILWIFINVMHADHKRACHWVRRKTAVCAVYSHCVLCILLVIQSRLLKSDFSRWRFNSKKVKKTRSTSVGKKKRNINDDGYLSLTDYKRKPSKSCDI